MSEVLDYIGSSDGSQKRMFMLVRSVILDTSPRVQEKLAYGVPFYYVYKNICYLNRLKTGIDLGFVRGIELSDQHGKLFTGTRSHIRSLRYASMEDIDEDILRETIQEALVLDEYHQSARTR